MKRILLSLSVIAAVVAIAAGVTTAFYQDTETSTGNTFAAGGIDLKVDSTAHYNGMVCVCPAGAACTWQPETNTQPPFYPAQGSACTGTWGQTDLKDGIRRFFDYKDLKPGDHGE
ncbi:MAG TPA: hypothetical protein DDX47_00295, partial [Candidatus Jacksonbacteria bacterium]|nr:hypothetical protein [Candidatus Jacksonbacteria bacterium]HCC49765.1 hypothetical protein [Candidatus Jacksonbacteria bacterium]